MTKCWTFRVWGFFAAVFLLSAVLWLPILASGAGMSAPVNVALMGLITFVPSATGILFTYWVKDKEGRRDFWRRAFRWPKAPAGVLAAALLILPAVNLISYSLSCWLAGRQVTLEYASQLFSSFPLLLQYLFVEITFGALSEELGWRGYVLDELQTRWGVLKSVLVLGVLWGLWHTPAFLVPGLAQYEMGGLLSPAYLAFVFGAVASSVIQGWAYNRTGRSILVAGFLMHFLTNLSLTLFAGTFDQFSLPPGYWAVSSLAYLGVAGFVVLLLRRSTPFCSQKVVEISEA